MIEELCTDKIAESVVNNNYGKPIEEIAFLIDVEYAKYESEIWFPGNRVFIYPSIKTLKAKKFYESPYRKIISLYETYINYHALLINETKGSKYVLSKPLRFELTDRIPANISELEELERSNGLNISLRKVKSRFNI